MTIKSGRFYQHRQTRDIVEVRALMRGKFLVCDGERVIDWEVFTRDYTETNIFLTEQAG